MIVGDKNSNLILQTSGKVYIKTNNAQYELNYRNETSEETSPEVVVEEKNVDLSNYVTVNDLKNILSNYVTQKDFSSIKKTQQQLESAQLSGFTEKISPVSIDTMQLIVGSEALQFEFITDTNDDTLVAPNIILMGRTLILNKNYIKHYSLFGPEEICPEHSLTDYAR